MDNQRRQIGGWTFLKGCAFLLVSAAVLAAGCNQAPDAQQQLDEQAQKNEELQEQIDELKEAQDKQESSEPAGKPDVVVEQHFASPSNAPEGVVAVAPSYNVDAVGQEEVSVLTAAENYYAAAEMGDYETTWSLLSGSDQMTYPLGDWLYANQVLDSAAGEFVIYNVEPASGYSSGWYYVDLTVYQPDGSSFNRRTKFVWENGHWVHWLTAEEMQMFDGALY